MNCLANDNQWHVGFRPTSPVISLITATYNGKTPAAMSVVVHDEDDNPVDYFTEPGDAATVLEGPTVSNGILSVKVESDGALLTAVCPITN
jgi:hypothetical protein